MLIVIIVLPFVIKPFSTKAVGITTAKILQVISHNIMTYQLYGMGGIGSWWWVILPKNTSIKLIIIIILLMPSIALRRPFVSIRTQPQLTSLAKSIMDHKLPSLMDRSSAQMVKIGYSDMIVVFHGPNLKVKNKSSAINNIQYQVNYLIVKKCFLVINLNRLKSKLFCFFMKNTKKNSPNIEILVEISC